MSLQISRLLPHGAHSIMVAHWEGGVKNISSERDNRPGNNKQTLKKRRRLRGV